MDKRQRASGRVPSLARPPPSKLYCMICAATRRAAIRPSGERPRGEQPQPRGKRTRVSAASEERRVPHHRQRPQAASSLTLLLGIEGSEEGVLERVVLHRLAKVAVHLAGRREDALHARRRGIRRRPQRPRREHGEHLPRLRARRPRYDVDERNFLVREVSEAARHHPVNKLLDPDS